MPTNFADQDMIPVASFRLIHHVEGDTSKGDLKKDKKTKKKKKGKEAEMTGQKHTLDSTIENAGSEHAERDRGEGRQSSKSKKSKRKHKDGDPDAEGSAGDQIVISKSKKRKKDHSVVLEVGSQVDITKMGEKRESKKKRRKESGKVGPDLSHNATAGGGEADVDGKNDKKKKKGKERIGGKKEKEKAAQLKDVGRRVSFADDVEVLSIDGGDVEDGGRSGESKLKDGNPDAEGSAGDQIVISKSKKRKKDHSVVLEVGSQVDITKMGEKRKSKKKRRKESGKVGPDLSHNATAGGEEADVGGKNDKKKKKGKERIGGKKEKEKAARLKDVDRRVSFADDVEVFSIDDGDVEDGGRSGESKLVHGQRFTPEEDATLMEAIMNYAEMKQLGEKGLEMIRESIKHPELKGCWADIGTSLPHRPSKAIYHRARTLLHRSDERKWTQEEYEKIRWFVKINGTNWKTLAKELGKSDIHVKDTWRRIKPKNLKAGAWTQDEYQNLFDLVNLDLRVKAHQQNDPGHRLLRDNISWEAISDKLTTRNHKNCCLKWYKQLASPLVKQGIWADADDYRLMEALQKVEAVCVEDVDWESLLDHRSGEVCRQRWNQMVRNIGGHKEKPFIEQLEVLSKRYCPEMLDYRESEV